MKILTIISILCMLCNTIYAEPVSIEGKFLLEPEQVKRIELCVKKESGWLHWKPNVLKGYRIWVDKNRSHSKKWQKKFNNKSKGRVARTFWRGYTKGNLLVFDGFSEDVFTHELAHVYGADEIEANEIEWKCQPK